MVLKVNSCSVQGSVNSLNDEKINVKDLELLSCMRAEFVYAQFSLVQLCKNFVAGSLVHALHPFKQCNWNWPVRKELKIRGEALGDFTAVISNQAN